MSTFPERGLQAYYPCDTLPEIPDNAAGTTYLQDAWATVDGWSANGNTLSVSGGVLRATRGGGSAIYRSVTSVNAKVWRARIRASTTMGVRFSYYNGSTYPVLGTLAATTDWQVLCVYLPSGSTDNIVYMGSSWTGTQWFEVDWIYVGSGLYDTLLADNSGNARNATVYAACPQPGISGNGLGFNGATARCTYATVAKTTMTMAAWIKFTTTTADMRVIQENGGSGAYVRSGITISTKKASLAWRKDASTSDSLLGTTDINDGAWHHVAGVWDTSTVYLYVDGVLNNSKSSILYNVTPDATGYIASNAAPAAFFSGYIDEPRIYSRALSADEIAIMYREITAKSDYGYLESGHEDIAYTATWDKSFSFTYVAGTTVVIKPTLSDVVPVGSTVKIYAGETIATLTECPPDVETGLVFVSTVSGATNLYVRMVLFTSSRAYNPTVASLNILVKQSTSLYTLATQILSDGLTPANAEWDIDLELQKYLIPYAWMKTKSHRKAIGEVAEAAGGVAYQDRYGIVRVEAGNYLQRETSLLPVSTIGQDRILNLTSPISTVKNRIQVQTWPYTPDTSQTIWELSSAKAINSGEVISFDVTWQDIEAAIDCSAAVTSSPAGATITAETYYSYGAHIEVTGSSNGQSITALTITGKPLAVVGGELITETDGESMRRNGDKTLSIMENKLIQSSALAETIAEAVIATTADEFRDVSIDWRGDPTLELGDKVSVDDIVGLIVTQEFSFNGALKAKAQVRKV